MRAKSALLAVGAVVLVAGVSALSVKLRRKPPGHLDAPAAAIVTDTGVTLHGTIRPQHVVGVGASIPGNIDTFLVEVGQEVFEGQVLARLGSTGLDTAKENAQQAVEKAQDQVNKSEAAVNTARMEVSRAEADAQRARAQMDRAQRTAERQTTLHRAGATPKNTYEKAVQEYEAAIKEFDVMDQAMRGSRENVQTASNRLAETRKLLAQRQEEAQDAEDDYSSAEVRAPVSGTVVGRSGEIGKPAEAAGEQMFQIATDFYALEVPLDATPD